MKVIKNNIIPICLLLAIIILEVLLKLNLLTVPGIPIVRAVLYAILSLSIIYPKSSYYTVFVKTIQIGIPVSILLIAIGVIINPLQMDIWSYEDGPIENLSSAFLLFSSIIWTIYGLLQIKNKRWKIIAVSLIMSTVFFVIGMEEISWGQRIFSIDSPDYFLENNMQKELNLHNLNTPVSEIIYYTMAAVVLIILPFFRNSVSKIFAKIKNDWLSVFLPSAWIAPSLSIIFSLTSKAIIW